jgi:hypothetical protein
MHRATQRGALVLLVLLTTTTVLHRLVVSTEPLMHMPAKPHHMTTYAVLIQMWWTAAALI